MLTYQLKRSDANMKKKQIDLEKEVHTRFKDDIKGRLKFVDKVLDFQKLSNEVLGKVP